MYSFRLQAANIGDCLGCSVNSWAGATRSNVSFHLRTISQDPVFFEFFSHNLIDFCFQHVCCEQSSNFCRAPMNVHPVDMISFYLFSNYFIQTEYSLPCAHHPPSLVAVIFGIDGPALAFWCGRFGANAFWRLTLRLTFWRLMFWRLTFWCLTFWWRTFWRYFNFSSHD